DPAPLAQSDVVRRIEHDGPRRLRVTVDDAASALPEVVEAVTANGGEVASAREYRPSFDEVFAILVQRDRAAHATAAADDESGEAA
ncbi:MAG TPA: DUF4162 domain-containing protein, partial [Candidatus Saccharimonadales bacterium]|nr:DUF4162 domain-containing protein [Candidatus Saccharimonadales bacterium]